ncbi:hypothetical protein BGZ95_001087 [Linnemannia exigua]|uniref:Amidohydrolase-related domain-containing protein n=1 Tax=Linnemannia exigua TaxID=604196 RepID=A0AAD4D949_9FUNG|nr:hypothetical protein BGZ95_001087 [Linnemannia exigua]
MADYQHLPQDDYDDHAPRTSFGRNLKKSLTKQNAVLLATAAVAILAASSYWLGSSKEWSHHPTHFEQAGISPERFEYGVAKCGEIHRKDKHQYPDAETRTFNPRFVNGTKPTVFKNGFIFDGVNESYKGDVLVDQGVVVKVGGEIKPPKDAVVVDLKGHILTPGIVDMHSHLGVFSWPILDATNDFNEMTEPLVPFARSIDGFNPSDVARERAVSGGITSILVLPGSSNLMGGEAFAFKLRLTDTLSAEDMLIEYGNKDKWRYMKMACGENPKNRYGRQVRMPSTRLGEGWLFRERFSKATKLKLAQDDWCAAAAALPRWGRHRLSTPFPEELQYESLVALLRGDVRLNVHCYETHDIEAMVDHSNEFKFEIKAFHHALDAYRVPDILKRAYNYTPMVATFAAKFGYKKEAFQASVLSPKILVDAGIAVAMKSDHPIVDSQHLVYQAAMAHHYGLTELQALASVTSVPAKAMGLEHRIGKVAIGMDADLVIWEKHPLSLGAHPLQVYIDGIAQIKNVNPEDWSEQESPLIFKESPELVVPKVRDACSAKAKDAVFTGIKKIIREEGEEVSSKGELVVIVRNGEVVCSGLCRRYSTKDTPVYDLGGEGVVLPSLLSVGTPLLGLMEIPPEHKTGDGDLNLNDVVINAADGLKFGGLHMDEAFKSGVLVGVTAPSSAHVVQGVSVAFSTGAEDALSSKNAVLKEQVALHVRIGQESKSILFPTVSSQIQFLRSSLEKGLSHVFDSNNFFAQAARGSKPLIVEVHNRDEIIRIVQIKTELEKQGASIKLVLLGATEAWTVAKYLALEGVDVILRPYHCMPVQWTAQRCLAGAPLTQETGLSALHKAGVRVGLSAIEFEDLRQMSWFAGWARSDLGLTEREAVGLVSWNLAKIVGLSAETIASSGVVIYNGSPFEFGPKVAAIVGGGKPGIQCNPRAF